MWEKAKRLAEAVIRWLREKRFRRVRIRIYKEVAAYHERPIGTGWERYLMSEDDYCTVHIHVRLKLEEYTDGIPWTDEQRDWLRDVQRPAWKARVEELWSDQFPIRRGNGDDSIRSCIEYRLRVWLDWDDETPHHIVSVNNAANSPNDQLHFGLDAHPNSVAHEFGHMLGLGHDEVDRSIMYYSGVPDVRVMPHHYQHLADRISEATGGQYFVAQ